MSEGSNSPQDIYQQVRDSSEHIQDLARTFLNNLCQSNDLISDNVQLLTSILESMNDGLVVVDENNNLILTNGAATRLAGIDTELEWLTQLKEHYEFYTSTTGYRIKAGEGGVVATLQDRQPRETEVFVRSSRIRPEGAWFRLSSAPIVRQDGKLLGVVTVFQDISAAKSALRKARELYNTAPCGYHSLTPDGVIGEINDTEINWLGLSRDQLVNRRKFSDFLTSSTRSTFAENFALLESRGFASNVELELVGTSGEIRNVLWSSMASNDQNGRMVASRCTLFDFTERKALQQELDALAALIAHDIKNHLVATAGVMEHIADDMESQLSNESKAIMKTLQVSNQDQLQSLNNLINLWAAGVRMPSEELDIRVYTEEAASLVAELGRLRNVKIEIDTENSLPKVWAPPTALRHVLCNLLHNALKFSKSGQTVRVKAYTENGGVTTVITDNGPGMSKKEMENLFKVRTGKKPRGFSSGLGLYLCRQIVEAAGGSIKCESETGKGTRFFLHLKIKQLAASARTK